MTPPGEIDAGRTGVFISTYNRGRYTRLSLASLERHRPDPATRIFVVDDASGDFGVAAFGALEGLRATHPSVRVFKNPRTLGIARMVHRFVELAAIFGVEYLYITDNDLIYGRAWFAELLRCYAHFSAYHHRAVVSCLNVPKHRVVDGAANTDEFVQKQTIGGASWLASLGTMREILTPDIDGDWDVRCITRLRTLGGIIGCTRRSFVQHIGAHGLHSHGAHDRGIDFIG